MDDVMVSMQDLDHLDAQDTTKPRLQQDIQTDASLEEALGAASSSSESASQTSDQRSYIDQAAEAFVDSDETLNAQISAENSKKLPSHSGYPYVD